MPRAVTEMTTRADALAAQYARQDAHLIPKNFWEPSVSPWHNSRTYAKILQEQCPGLSFGMAITAVARHFPTLFLPDDLAGQDASL